MDHHATTPLDPRILDAITPYYLDEYSTSEAQQAIAFQFQNVTKGIFCCKVNAAGDFFDFRTLLKGFYLTK